ncbi:MAG TPA: glycosyltransferase family 39 protein [Acidobacteriaceae bacterium]
MQGTSRYVAKPIVGWAQLAAALAAGLVLRLVFVHFYGQTQGDSLLYGDIAKNLLQHGVFGLNRSSGVTPTLLRLPGYPLFLVACFKTFGMEHYRAVMLVQCALDLGTCALAAGTAARLWGRQAGVWTLWLAALCPFTANYVATALTETPTLFCIALAFYALTRWRTAANGAALGLDRFFWMMAGALAYAILLRPDGGLLAAAVVPAVALLAWHHREREEDPPATKANAAGITIVLCLAILAPLVPWTYRNLHQFHVIEPLAPRYATDPGEMVTYGFNHWYRSWGIDFASTEDVFWNMNEAEIQIEDIPTRAFDNDEQYDATDKLLRDYNQTTTLTPEMDYRFQLLADARKRANPMRYYLVLPVARLVNMLLRPRTEILPVALEWWQYKKHPAQTVFALGYAVLNFFYFAAAGLGAWAACRRLPREQLIVIYAMLAYVVMRSLLLMTMDNAEERYTLEFLPLAFVLAGSFCSRVCDKEEPSGGLW